MKYELIAFTKIKVMKKIYLPLLLLVLIFASMMPVSAQGLFNKVKGNKNIVKVTKSVASFDKIDASGIDHVILMPNQNGENYVIVETDENVQPHIQVNVRHQTLSFLYKNIDPSELKLYVHFSNILTGIEASGASSVKSTLPLKGDKLSLDISGASHAQLLLEYKNVSLDNSGASHARLMGHCNEMDAEMSGAALLNAEALNVDSLYISASGASVAKIRVSKYLRKNVSGAARINLVSQSGKDVDINTPKKVMKVVTYRRNMKSMRDTTHVNIGSFRVEVVDGDSTKINVGNHVLVVDDNGNVRWGRRNHKRRFKGHWGGVDLGVNGFVTPEFNTNFGAANDYLSLRYEKSLNVNINFLEKNIPLNKANTVGFVTGMGLSLKDYRFTNPVYLYPNDNTLSGYYIHGTSVRKSKLSVAYLTVPLLLEFQSNEYKRSRRFFISLGVIGNLMLRSHSKIYFNTANQHYYLKDPATGTLQPEVFTTPNTGSRNIQKRVGGFYLNPFRVDATLRMGFSWLSLYATYGLTPMFQSARGPELHQWSLGISCLVW